MNYRTIGQTDIKVSEIGLGTWAFASRVYGNVSESDAITTIKTALDAGITLFDTAPLYGDAEQDGISEKILGHGLGTDREKILISTKFGRRSTQRAAPNFHAQGARESVEASLKRLDTDHIDILFFHSPFSRDTVFSDNNLNKRYDREEITARVDYIENLSFLIRDSVKNMPQAALRWVLDNPHISLVLSGAMNPAELQDAILASDLQRFTDSEHQRTQKFHTQDFQAA